MPRPRPQAGELIEIVYGVRAVEALATTRPRDLRRIWYDDRTARDLQSLLRTAAAERVPYRIANEEELAKVAGALHHEGVVVRARAREPLGKEAFARRMGERPGFGLALDRIANPHNLGAILRSAAFFGASGVLLGTGDGQARLGPAAVRIAEGGAEHVAIAEAPSLGNALAFLRTRGVRVIGTDAGVDRDLFATALARPCIVVLGNEREGLSPEIRRQCHEVVAIRGAGGIDSLNVSVAAGVVLAQLARG